MRFDQVQKNDIKPEPVRMIRVYYQILNTL